MGLRARRAARCEFDPGTAEAGQGRAPTFLFQMHYTPTGKAVKDRTYIGLRFAKSRRSTAPSPAARSIRRFAFPPGDPNYEVKSTLTRQQDVALIGFMPHMHLRGKDFQYTVVYPTAAARCC